MAHKETEATDPQGPTGSLCTWLAEATLKEIPIEVQNRAKHLLLDGIGCLLVGSHLDWSTLGVEALTAFDEGGEYLLAGWGKKSTNAFTAAMLNSSFIQGFELDDYYPAAPLHSNSIVLPAMIAVSENLKKVSGADFLLSLILGYEVGTRVGLSLHGTEMLSRGWHSGVVFGGPASAASAGKLMQFSAAQFEDAIGIASTQACGLMSAQFESMIKRMQHGFAARNGLYGAVLAQRGYVGIKRVFERDYGGFLPVFGEGHDPDYSQITVDLNKRWTTTEIAIKPYAAMGGLHAGIDAALVLRQQIGSSVGKPLVDQIKAVRVEVGKAAFSHGGFEIKRPIEPITAQMSLKYSTSVALLDGGALLNQFSNKRINSDDVWKLIDKTTICHEDSFDQKPHTSFTTRVTLTLQDGSNLQQLVETPRGGEDHPLSNDDIVNKFKNLLKAIADESTSETICDFVLNLEKQKQMLPMFNLIKEPVKNALS
jgi:aconitate decarboxylase